MSPVLNTMLPTGNAITPVPASLPVQALQPLRPFELAIPATTVPGETEAAPAQIAPGKMLNVEGSTPADTAIPADVIPANAIELLNASVMREDAQPATPAEPTPEQAAKPRWAIERYLPTANAAVTRPAKLPIDAEAEAETEDQDAAAVAPAIDMPVKTSSKAKSKADTPAEPEPAQQPAMSADGIAPQIAPPVLAYNPTIISNAAAPIVKADVAPSIISASTTRPLTANQAALPETIVPGSSPDTATPAETARALKIPVAANEISSAAQPVRASIIAVAAKIQSDEPVSDQPVIATSDAAPMSGVAWPRPASPKVAQVAKAKTDTYAFVSINHKVETGASARGARNTAEQMLDSATPVAVEGDAPAATAAQLLPVDMKANDISLVQVEGVKTANPLAELSGASHVAQRHLDLARDTQWLDGLARDIVAASDRSGSMSFRLSPANLGQLDVALENGDAGLSVVMTTSSDEATKIVTAAQPTLIDTIQSQGVRVADAQVMSQTDMSRQGQPQRQAPAAFIETGFAGSQEPETQDSKQPRGRFA